MKKEMFTDLMGSAREALEHARGKRSLRTRKWGKSPRRACGTLKSDTQSQTYEVVNCAQLRPLVP